MVYQDAGVGASSEIRGAGAKGQLNGGGLIRNRLPEIAASPIYSESGGAPGRKFFMSINNGSQPGNMGGAA